MTALVENAIDDRTLEFIGQLILPSGACMSDTFESDPWQVTEVIGPALAKRADGLPANRYLVDVEPKGSGKSTRGAAMLVTECVLEARTHCFVVAVDAEQAAITLEALAGLISRFPRLRSTIRQRQNLFTFSNGSFIKVMASHEPSFHGVGATARRLRFLLEELCQWPTPALYWAAQSSMAKVPDSALWVLTNAGISGTWQETALEQLKAAGAHMFIAPPGWLPSWVNRADVEALRQTLPEPIWRRYFNNEWVAEVGQAIDSADWDACKGAIPPLDATTPVIVGLDAAISGDSFAAIAVSRALPAPADVLPEHYRSETDGQRAYRRVDYSYGISLLKPPEGDTGPPSVWVRCTKIWRPERGNIDFGVPYAWLSDFAAEHNIAAVCYDPWQLHDFCTRWRQEHGIFCKAFDQGPRRSQADCDLLQLIRARRFRHDGDAQLREHALNAAIRITPREDTKGRLVKAHPSKKVDGLIATSMAAAECLRLHV